ncbi:hypothetical protein AAFF_G00108480 [Aldrovandia affinis]|uniref:Uncharacterized protein n=1 Tax=Aldrovandia affinis TaxID=143900 RepID=A0AAD7RTV4_9TELE|nr:hypothetical protein AAFF_G00108480 [Aldrovandia affinis]
MLLRLIGQDGRPCCQSRRYSLRDTDIYSSQGLDSRLQHYTNRAPRAHLRTSSPLSGAQITRGTVHCTEDYTQGTSPSNKALSCSREGRQDGARSESVG